MSLDERVTPEVALVLAEALLHVVAPAHHVHTHAPHHPAVKRMCALLDTQTAEGKIRVGPLAQHSGLSARQLRHRFTEELGINPSAYLRWRRLRRAIAAVEAGATLTRPISPLTQPGLSLRSPAGALDDEVAVNLGGPSRPVPCEFARGCSSRRSPAHPCELAWL